MLRISTPSFDSRWKTMRFRALLVVMKWTSVGIVVAFPALAFATQPTDVSSSLEKIREEYDVPALAAAAFDEGELVAIGADGVRNVRRNAEVTDEDLWILSSCTKSMTASVAAMLVEDGVIKWTSTLGETFPDVSECMHADWRDVTLEQLLTHRGGAPHEPPDALQKAAEARAGKPRMQRFEFLVGLIGHKPAAEPGTKWIYSDSGYAMAGAMLERAANRDFEGLMRDRLFTPLGLKSAGFGPPAKPDKADQPWGHHGYESPFKPVAPGPDADYPPTFAPAATVHMSVTDFARYANWHVQGDRGHAPLLTHSSFAKLHTPADGQEYAMGWAVTNRRWAGGRTLMHSGENTNFYAVMWLSPGENTCFVAVCNADCADAETACDAAIRLLINRF